MSVTIYGFTLIRNGLKYDYPFQESLTSLSPICEKIYLALGESDDGTEEAARKLDKIVPIPTVWDENLKSGGVILSQQTNVALDALRKDHGDDDHAWGFYLQGDEMLHQDDLKQIVEDIQKADEQGCDVVSFRYHHFWLKYNQVAIDWRWYPQEIRAIKLKSSIESWGDAQGFRNHNKLYESDAYIYHYGHVREEEAYKRKKWDILYYYHNGNEKKMKRKLYKHEHRRRRPLPYYGLHPKVMKERIGNLWSTPEKEHVYIVGEKTMLPESFWQRVKAKNLHFASSPRDFRKINAKDIVFLKDKTFWQRLRYPSKVPRQNDSELSRPWTKEVWAMMKLSEKNIGFKSETL